jgi:very-short-patch-repair endonuclease
MEDVDKLYSRGTFWARSHRRAETPAEAALWALLRNRQLLGQKFRRQHPIGRYFADFYCAAARLAIEADGSSHDGRVLRDRRRDAWFRRQGVTLLRFPNAMILHQPQLVLAQIRHAIARSAPPLPQGEGAGG